MNGHPPPDDPRGVPRIGVDPDAFEAFYREHLDVVRRAVARRVDDPHLAADLTADVFLAVVDGAAGYDPRLGPPRAWLVGIARHVVARHRRSSARALSAARRVDGRALLDEDSADRIVARIDAEAAARALYRSLDDLPENQRAVVELVAVDGLSPAEAAQVLGIAPTAARVRYHRARRTLRGAFPELLEVSS